MESEPSPYETAPNLAAAPEGTAIAIATSRLFELIQAERNQAAASSTEKLRQCEHKFRKCQEEYSNVYGAGKARYDQLQKELVTLKGTVLEYQKKAAGQVDVVQRECDDLRAQLAAIQRDQPTGAGAHRPDSGESCSTQAVVDKIKRGLKKFGFLYYPEAFLLRFGSFWQQILAETGTQDLGWLTPAQLQVTLKGVAEKLKSDRVALQTIEGMVGNCKEERVVQGLKYQAYIAHLNAKLAFNMGRKIIDDSQKTSSGPLLIPDSSDSSTSTLSPPS